VCGVTGRHAPGAFDPKKVKHATQHALKGAHAQSTFGSNLMLRFHAVFEILGKDERWRGLCTR